VAGKGGMNMADRDLEILFDVGVAGTLTDGQLLGRFVERREGAVFEAIVRRHGPMVRGVCRRVLRDPHDADDAYQATFLVLARKAASIAHREQVGNWLYGVAYRTAVKARAMRSKRRKREGRVSEMTEPATAPDDPMGDLVESLDRELSRLPRKYRLPVVLCDLEGRTHREAADQLGWPVGTVSSRLSRAKALLARRMSRYGVALSVGSLAVLLARDAASAGMPTWSAGSTARSASLFATWGTTKAGVGPAGVAALAREVVKSMFLSRIKRIVALLVLAFGLTGGGGLAYRAWASDHPGRDAPRPEAAEPPTAAAQPQGQPVDQTTSYPFKIDADDVYELSDLKVEYRGFRLETGPVSVVPISTERGVAGAMIIGSGKFSYTPKGGRPIEGQARSVMLRFSPDERAAILPLDGGKRISDRGITEMARHMLQVVIQHCWQSTKDGGRRQEVLIPPKGAFAAAVYSKEHGDLLISFDAKTTTVFNFTDRKTVYERNE